VREERGCWSGFPPCSIAYAPTADANGLSAETLKTAGVAVARAMSRYLDAILEAAPSARTSSR